MKYYYYINRKPDDNINDRINRFVEIMDYAENREFILWKDNLNLILQGNNINNSNLIKLILRKPYLVENLISNKEKYKTSFEGFLLSENAVYNLLLHSLTGKAIDKLMIKEVLHYFRTRDVEERYCV